MVEDSEQRDRLEEARWRLHQEESRHGQPGNLLSDGVYTYTFNHTNRLVSVSGAGTTVNYGYNRQGDRVSLTFS